MTWKLAAKITVMLLACHIAMCAVLGVVLSPMAHAQDAKQKKTTEKELRRKERAQLEDAVRRGVGRIKKIEGQDLVQVTVSPSLTLDNPTWIIMAEFANGDVGFFQGGPEEDDDQLVVVDKRFLEQVRETVTRGLHK